MRPDTRKKYGSTEFCYSSLMPKTESDKSAARTIAITLPAADVARLDEAARRRFRSRVAQATLVLTEWVAALDDDDASAAA